MKSLKIPMRMCLGCNEMKPKKELMRVVKSAEGLITITVQVFSSIEVMMVFRVLAGASARDINSSGFSLHGIISIFSPLSSLTTAEILDFPGPIQAPTASTFASFENMAIFVLEPASREIDLISTIPSSREI